MQEITLQILKEKTDFHLRTNALKRVEKKITQKQSISENNDNILPISD